MRYVKESHNFTILIASNRYFLSSSRGLISPLYMLLTYSITHSAAWVRSDWNQRHIQCRITLQTTFWMEIAVLYNSYYLLLTCFLSLRKRPPAAARSADFETQDLYLHISGYCIYIYIYIKIYIYDGRSQIYHSTIIIYIYILKSNTW